MLTLQAMHCQGAIVGGVNQEPIPVAVYQPQVFYIALQV
jgi:hypothetical protein